MSSSSLKRVDEGNNLRNGQRTLEGETALLSSEFSQLACSFIFAWHGCHHSSQIINILQYSIADILLRRLKDCLYLVKAQLGISGIGSTEQKLQCDWSIQIDCSDWSIPECIVGVHSWPIE